MNLSDLRSELATRAREPGRQPDLLPGVREKIRTTQRNRRAAGAAAVLVALAVVAVGVVPGLIRPGTPEPAQSPTATPPADYEAGGVTFPGKLEDGARLQKAFVGNQGQTQATFEWTPGADALTVAGVCSSAEGDQAVVEVSIDGVEVFSQACIGSMIKETLTYFPDSGLWTVVRPGRPSVVKLEVVSLDGAPVDDSIAVIGVGLYIAAPEPVEKDPMPTRTPPTSPDDYLNDGFRYRAKVGGSTLVKAMIGERGRTTLTFEFTPSSNRLRVSPFCFGETLLSVEVRINDAEQSASQECGFGTRDVGGHGYAAGEPGAGWPGVLVGQPNTITVRLTGKGSSDWARIGVGIYQEGEKQVVAPGVELDKVVEHGGYDYRLAEFRAAAAKESRLSLPTPAGTPFLVYYGITATGASIDSGSLRLDGLDGPEDPDDIPEIYVEPGGFATMGQPARGAGYAAVGLQGSKPDKGVMVIAVYEPVR